MDHPRPPSLSRIKRGIDEVLAFFAALDSVGFKAETFFLQAATTTSSTSPLLLHGRSRQGRHDLGARLALGRRRHGRPGSTSPATSISDQHQMDAFIWANFPLKPLPERLVG